MLIKSIIMLLMLYDDSLTVNFDQYDLAPLQLAGFVNDNNKLTPQGRVIVQEILSFVGRVI